MAIGSIVDNFLSNVQALTAATSLHESFTIHTKDGTPQTIDSGRSAGTTTMPSSQAWMLAL
ncbi:VCBS domain-containing protein [Vibrio lentus]|nr:VCBS domain-containing protein [Vibrio lentus]